MKNKKTQIDVGTGDIYTIEYFPDYCKVSWNHSKGNSGSRDDYTHDEVNNFLENGTWKLVKVLESGEVEEANQNPFNVGGTIKLTNQIKATIVSGDTVSGDTVSGDTVSVTTKMSIGGGGGRNLIVWSLLASKKGYTNVIVKTPDADNDAIESLTKAVIYANEMLSHLGVNVSLEK